MEGNGETNARGQGSATVAPNVVGVLLLPLPPKVRGNPLASGN